MSRPSRRGLLAGGTALLAAPGLAPGLAWAQAAPLRIGLILPMTGPFASTGRQVDAAVRAWLRTNGEVQGGHKLEILLRDDGGVQPDTTRRLAQELAVRDKVKVLAGFGLTPLALASAPIATEAKLPMVVMAAATAIIPQRSPYIVRTSFTLPQVTAPIAEWAARNGIRSAASLVTDFAPGHDAEGVFKARFAAAGGRMALELRSPLRNPDYAPFLQRVKDAKPDALFIFCPSGEGAAIMKQFQERGLKEAGIKLIGTGDVMDDDILASFGPDALGTITSHHYSAAHDSAENAAFTSAFRAVAPTMRPNFMAVGGWDGMTLVAEAVKAARDTDGDTLLAAMKGRSWTSPRGPVTIAAETRDITQDVYIRRVESREGQLWNLEFDRVAQVPA